MCTRTHTQHTQKNIVAIYLTGLITRFNRDLVVRNLKRAKTGGRSIWKKNKQKHGALFFFLTFNAPASMYIQNARAFHLAIHEIIFKLKKRNDYF